MSDIIFLNPASAVPSDVATLTQLCKDVLLTKLSCRIVDEKLCPADTTNLIFDSTNGNWLTAPTPQNYEK